MSETPLQKLLRLRKEKEQANVNPSPASVSETQLETSALETVQGSGSNSPMPSGTEGSGVSSSEGRVALLEEGLHPDVSVVSSTISSKPALESTLVPQVVSAVQSKPMSAMERLRALKSGGSNGTSNSVNSSSVRSPVHDSQCDVQLEKASEEVKEVTPSKPRKTHPIAMEMAELEAALDAHVPGFVNILSTIHKKLRADPDIVTLLDDEEIAVIVAGLEKHTNVTIVAPSAVKAAKSKARKEPVSAMDL